MDGTLVDNMPIHFLTWISFLARYDIHLSLEELKAYNKGNLTEIISRIFNLEPGDPEVQRIGQAKEQFYRDTYRPQIKALPGLVDTLERLCREGITCALASNGDQPNIDLIVDGLDIRSYFTFTIGGHEVKKGKPDPEMFNACLNQLNLAPEDCLIFEDSFSGIAAANASGIEVVGVTTSHAASTLIKHGCIGAISNYRSDDIFQYLG